MADLRAILKHHGLKEKDLDIKCPPEVVNKIKENILDDWYMVGRELYVSDKRLNAIRSDHTRPGAEEKALAALDAWMEEKGRDATCLKLVEALQRRQMKRTIEILCEMIVEMKKPKVTTDEYDYTSPPKSPTEHSKAGIPNHVLSLPSLNPGTTTIGEVASTTNKLKLEFSTLFKNVPLSLQKLNVSPESVLSHLKSLEAVGPTFETASLSARSENFGRAVSRPLKSHQDLFPAIAPYCSWFNHLLVENLVESFCQGDENIVQQWKSFKQTFEEHCETRVCECPPDEFGEDHLQADTTSVVLGIDCRWKMMKMKRLHSIRGKLAELLHVKPYNFYLRAVMPNELLFRIPTFVAEKFIPPTAEQVIALQKVCIVQLRCDPQFIAQRCLTGDKSTVQLLSTTDFSSHQDIVQYLSERALQVYTMEGHRHLGHIGYNLKSMGDSFDLRMLRVESTLISLPLVFAYSFLLNQCLPHTANKLAIAAYVGGVWGYIGLIPSRYSSARSHSRLVVNELTHHYLYLFVNAPLIILLPYQFIRLVRHVRRIIPLCTSRT